MGKGIDAARAFSPEHAALIDDFKDQLLIVFLKRLGGKADFSVAEVDNTSGDLFAFSIRDGVFHFEIQKKA
jgi:hypothetical protein